MSINVLKLERKCYPNPILHRAKMGHFVDDQQQQQQQQLYLAKYNS